MFDPAATGVLLSLAGGPEGQPIAQAAQVVRPPVRVMRTAGLRRPDRGQGDGRHLRIGGWRRYADGMKQYKFVGGSQDGKDVPNSFFRHRPEPTVGERVSLPIPPDFEDEELYSLKEDGDFHFLAVHEIATIGKRCRNGVLASSDINYVSGCFRRERQRIARALREIGADERIIAAITDQSRDRDVFRFQGSTSLDRSQFPPED